MTKTSSELLQRLNPHIYVKPPPGVVAPVNYEILRHTTNSVPQLITGRVTGTLSTQIS